MHSIPDQQLSPTLVVKSLLANGFPEFSFADLLQEFKRHFPTQNTKTVYQSLYRVVERFVKKGYLMKQNQSDRTYIFLQTNLLHASCTSISIVAETSSDVAHYLRHGRLSWRI